MKKALIYVVALLAILTVIGAIIGVDKGRQEVKEGNGLAANKEEEEEVDSPTIEESDKGVVEAMLNDFYVLQGDLEGERDKRIDSNNMDSWGPYFKDFKDKINVKRDEIDSSEGLSIEDTFLLKSVYSGLLELAMSYGSEIAGDEIDTDLIEFHKNEIEVSLKELEEGS